MRRAAQGPRRAPHADLKGWCTKSGNEVAGTVCQVHGGMGFIEETRRRAVKMRDVRITTIYEGPPASSRNDLIGRKLGHDRGAAMAH